MADLYILYKTCAIRRKGKTAGREQQTDCAVATQQNRNKSYKNQNIVIRSHYTPIFLSICFICFRYIKHASIK